MHSSVPSKVIEFSEQCPEWFGLIWVFVHFRMCYQIFSKNLLLSCFHFHSSRPGCLARRILSFNLWWFDRGEYHLCSRDSRMVAWLSCCFESQISHLLSNLFAWVFQKRLLISLEEASTLLVLLGSNIYFLCHLVHWLFSFHSSTKLEWLIGKWLIGFFSWVKLEFIIPRVFRGAENKTENLVSSNSEQNRISAGHGCEMYSSVASHRLESRLLSVASRDYVKKCSWLLCHNYEISTQNDFNFHLTSSTEEA